MYVAQRELKVQDGLTPEGRAKIRIVRAGEAIPDAAKWPQTVLLAHLNLEWLRWEGDARPPHAEPGRKVVDLSHYKNSPEGVTKTAPAPESPRSTPEAGVTESTELHASGPAAPEGAMVTNPDSTTATRDEEAGAKAAETASPRLSKRERREQKKNQRKGA